MLNSNEDLLKAAAGYWSGIPSENDYTKIKDNKIIKAGDHILIKWKDREVEDRGYAFAVPVMDDASNLIINIPNPDNFAGIGDAPAVWTTHDDLLTNDRVESITITTKFSE